MKDVADKILEVLVDIVTDAAKKNWDLGTKDGKADKKANSKKGAKNE